MFHHHDFSRIQSTQKQSNTFLLVHVDDAAVRAGGQVTVVSRDVDGRAPDAAVVMKPVEAVLSLQIPNVNFTAD
jgi:hypothetical protein